ncbi:MAG: hypothetical protein Q4G08_07930, partial [Capnocytophaga sp.]|nr:hypothetical protein [Capnocytophaga sp.]
MKQAKSFSDFVGFQRHLAKAKFFILLAIAAVPHFMYSQAPCSAITVDAVSVNESACGNDGKVTLSVATTLPYDRVEWGLFDSAGNPAGGSIANGGFVANNEFGNLRAGTYTAKVRLFQGTTLFAECEKNTPITLTKVAESETVNISAPISQTLNCAPTGQLRIEIQKPIPGNSYTVELTAPAEYTGSKQITLTQADSYATTISNVPAGKYVATIRLACGDPKESDIEIAKTAKDFPTRSEFSGDQNYNDFGCDYMNVRYGVLTSNELRKFFDANMYEYAALSPSDMQRLGITDPKDIPANQWREIGAVPATVIRNQKSIYYDLAANGVTYKDLQGDATKRPNYYLRIKGSDCIGTMEVGNMRFMSGEYSFSGVCTNPQVTIKAEGMMACYPATYAMKDSTGNEVATGSIGTNGSNGGSTTFSVDKNGNPFSPSERYTVTITSGDGQEVSFTRSFDEWYASLRYDVGFIWENYCLGQITEQRGSFRVYHRRDGGGQVLPMVGSKITLVSAPAGYTDEPGKIKVGETITSDNTGTEGAYVLSTSNQNTRQDFVLPNGEYSIRIEDPCGNVKYVNYNRVDGQTFTVAAPVNSNKDLTPEIVTDCNNVRVYPFRGNPDGDWIFISGSKRRVYVILVGYPAGISKGDVTVTPSIEQLNRWTAYYAPANNSSFDSYFTLPKNVNSTGTYTFVYSNELSYITSYINGDANACVKTFTVDIQDEVLTYDIDTYYGYRCDDSPTPEGAIHIEAINGVNDNNTYKYELYDVREGTKIDEKTSGKGGDVTFTNLGTFAAGNSTRWVKITDNTCPFTPIWRELTVYSLTDPNILKINPVKSVNCIGDSVEVSLVSLGANNYVWHFPDGTQTTTTEPKLSIPSLQSIYSGTYTVTAVGVSCNGLTFEKSFDISVIQEPVAIANVAVCGSITVGDWISNLKNELGITYDVLVYRQGETTPLADAYTLLSSEAYQYVYETASCTTASATLTVTDATPTIPTIGTITQPTCTTPTGSVVLSDLPAGNWTITYGTSSVATGTGSSTTISDLVHGTSYQFTVENANGCKSVASNAVVIGNYICANDDTFTATASSTTASILDNDTLNNVNVSTPTVVGTLPNGLTLNPDGTVTIADDVPTGTYTFTYEICEVGAVPANCVTATVTIDVNNTIVANDDTFTATASSTTASILANDTLNNVNVSTPTVVGTLPTGLTLNPDGTVTIADDVPTGTYTFTYEICEVGAVPANCVTATVTIDVNNTIVANDDTFTATASSTTASILANDTLNNVNVSTPTVVGTLPTGLTLNPDGTVTIADDVPTGTYTFTYE